MMLIDMGRKQGKGLRGALQSHILSEKLTKKRHEASVSELERRNNKEKSVKRQSTGQFSRKQQNNSKPLIPFASSDVVLLVGEGDFSFACSLIKASYILPENLIASSYDSEQQLLEKYPLAKENLEFLAENSVSIYHSVDATNLIASLKLAKKGAPPLLQEGKKLNHIMFNFPHTGRGMKDMDRNIRDHQLLVLGFFKSSKQLLEFVNAPVNAKADAYLDESHSAAEDIILSVFDGEPYISWGIKALARQINFKVERSGRFDWDSFPGYHHRRTNSTRDTTKPAAQRDARIYIFNQRETE